MVKSALIAGSVLAVAVLAGSQVVRADERPVGQPQPTATTAQGEPAYRAKEILGAQVSLDGGTAAGTIDDIVLDRSGNVDYLIVVNPQRQLVTVPWDAAIFDVKQRQAVIHITPEQYRQIPTYTATQYPVFTAPTYRTQVYKYYGLTPGQQRRINERMDRHERREERRERRAND